MNIIQILSTKNRGYHIIVNCKRKAYRKMARERISKASEVTA